MRTSKDNKSCPAVIYPISSKTAWSAVVLSRTAVSTMALAFALLWSGCATSTKVTDPTQTAQPSSPPTTTDKQATSQPSQASSQPASSQPSTQPASSQSASADSLVNPNLGGNEPFDIPLASHPRIDKWVATFGGPRAQRFPRWLERYGCYAPMMRPILKQAGVPEDTIYLAMIESGFSPRAYSSARASGPWQFIASTGARYGLRDNFWLDERRDPEKATKAAATHLKDLHDEFGDWHLAWAAYNAGPGKVRTAIRRYQSRDFFELIEHPYLRPETKDYVPKIIAAAIVAKYRHRYGYSDIVPQPACTWDRIPVTDATDIGLVAAGCGVEVETLAELNPELKRWATPPLAKGAPAYMLRVPSGLADKCQRALEAVPLKKRLTFRHHRVRSGEMPSTIAGRYGISVKTLMTMNKIRNAKKLRAGADLLIPIPSRVPQHLLGAHRVEQRPGDTGDQNLRLARAKAKDRINRAKRRTTPPRQKGLEIPPGKTAQTYVVQPGDSLWAIAQKHRISVAQLKKWNHYRNTPILRPGQKIVFYK